MDAPPDLEITITDIRNAGHCGKLRPWFRQHGLDDELRDLIKGGTISAEKMLATGDPRAIRVVRIKIESSEAADG